jgi:hypothetical protein
MISLRAASTIAVMTATIAELAVGAASARGGHSHGRASTAATLAAPHVQQVTPLAASSAATPAASTPASSIPSSSLKAATALPAVPTPLAPTPASVIGAPAPQTPALAPLSPAVVTTTSTGGGAARTDTVASPSSSSTSPTEAAPSVAGGGGKTLQDCLRYWDPAAHMTKAEWRGACERSQHRLESLKLESVGIALPKTTRR